MTVGHESTKLTSSFAIAAASKRPHYINTTGGTPFASAFREVEDHLSEMMAESAQGLLDHLPAPGPMVGASDDEIFIQALMQSDSNKYLLGVTPRKLKSLNFRAKRRHLKMLQSGTPFNRRDNLKNSNRSKAALQRKRDGNGKFLDIPIYPKKQVQDKQQCKIFA